MSDPQKPSSRDKRRSAAAGEETRRTHPLLVLAAGFISAFLLLLCCTCGGALWWFRPQIHEDPERARQLLAEIVEIRIPEPYMPTGTVETNVAFLMTIRGVYYERFVGDGILAIVEVNSRVSADADVRRHIRQTLLEKGGGGAPLILDASETERILFEIAGRQVPFTVETGRDPPTGRVFRIVEGVFDGRSGQVLLTLRVNEERWADDEPAVMEMIRSIGEPQTEDSPPRETGGGR